jgi:hypothetical protein
MMSPRKELKSVLSAGKIMVAMFWNEKGVVLVNCLPNRTTVSFDRYIEMLIILNAHLC